MPTSSYTIPRDSNPVRRLAKKARLAIDIWVPKIAKIIGFYGPVLAISVAAFVAVAPFFSTFGLPFFIAGTVASFVATNVADYLGVLSTVSQIAHELAHVVTGLMYGPSESFKRFRVAIRPDQGLYNAVMNTFGLAIMTPLSIPVGIAVVIAFVFVFTARAVMHPVSTAKNAWNWLTNYVPNQVEQAVLNPDGLAVPPGLTMRRRDDAAGLQMEHTPTVTFGREGNTSGKHERDVPVVTDPATGASTAHGTSNTPRATKPVTRL